MSTPTSIRIVSEGVFALWLKGPPKATPESPDVCDRIVVKLDDASDDERHGHSATLFLDEAFTLDPLLSKYEGGVRRLRSFVELQDDFKGLIKQAAANAMAELRLRLARQKLSIEAAGGGGRSFFGVQATANWSAEAELRLPFLAPGEAGPVELVGRAELGIKANLDLPGLKTGTAPQTKFTLEVVLSTTGNPLASLRSFIPDLPILDFSFLRLAFPRLSFDGLILPSFTPFALNVPDWCGIDVQPHWKQPPQLTLKVDQGALVVELAPTDLTIDVETKTLLTVEQFAFKLEGGSLDVSGTVTAGAVVPLDKLFPFGGGKIPVSGEIFLQQAEVVLTGSGLAITWTISRLAIQATGDAHSRIEVGLTLETSVDIADGKLKTKLLALQLIDLDMSGISPDFSFSPIGGLLRLNLAVPQGASEFLRRLGRLLAAVARYLNEAVGAIAGLLSELAQQAGALLADCIEALIDAMTSVDWLVLEVRLDAATMRPVQIVASVQALSGPDSGKSLVFGSSSLRLAIPTGLTPALIVDLRHGWTGLALLHDPAAQQPLTLSTNLWFDSPDQPSSAVGEMTKGGSEPKPLVSITATPTGDVEVVLLAIQHGRPKFLQAFGVKRGDLVGLNGHAVRSVDALTDLAPLNVGSDDSRDIKLAFDASHLKDKITSLLPQGASNGGGFLDELSQSVRISVDGDVTITGKTIASLPLKLQMKAGEWQADASMLAQIDLHTFKVAIGGSDAYVITTKPLEQDVFGLKFVANPGKGGRVFRLAFGDGGFRLEKVEDAALEVRYDRLSSNGEGLKLEVTTFAIGRGGLDLEAHAKESTARLAGLDQAFTFNSGSLQIQGGKLIGGTLSGAGALPPALVGEANAEIDLVFGVRDGRFTVVAANAKLEKEGEPLYSSGTRFRITIDALGLDYKEVSGGKQHFYFLLWGEAAFEPNGDEFASGLLQNIRSVAIKLDAAPLTGDARELLNHIEFQVEVDPPLRASLFDIFKFELRGIGFHPASDLWADRPAAMAISGQVSFLEAGDAVSSEIDFHRLWITKPDPKEGGTPLPRIRADGLSVLVRIGSVAQIEATAVAVDGKIPSLYAPIAMPANINAEGFLASGRLDISGLGAYGASVGFLELSKEGSRKKRHAMFAYAQAEKLSERIDTPIGPLFIREVGLGIGKNYTLAGIAAADDANTPSEMVKVLDEVAKYQANLIDFKSWTPQYDKNYLTLALRGLITLASASPDSSSYNAAGEKSLANPLLINIVLGLRSDLTVFATVTGHIAWNYSDWQTSKSSAPWKEKPSLIGYLYFSVPRKELLARFLSNPKGEVGDHPKLPDALKKALTATRFSATMYIRPGLFHVELGWPYELGFDLGKPGDAFWLSVSGGLVHRIEDATALYGLAFSASGAMRLGGTVGGSSFGASAVANATFAIGAKFIAFIAPFNPDDTIFYGEIFLKLTLDIGVSVWLSFRIFKKRITIRIGFSISLTVAISAEVVVGGEGIGARVYAAVGVSGFGRTLSVGIGFSFGASKLEKARARVARFLELGLGIDPPKGDTLYAPAPAGEVSRKQRSMGADDALDFGPPRPAKEPEPEQEPGTDDLYFPIPGNKIPATDWWALLFDAGTIKKGERDIKRYLMQLVPRDDQEGAGGEVDVGFFAEPLLNDELGGVGPPQDYELSGGALPTLHLSAGGADPPVAITNYQFSADRKRVVYESEVADIRDVLLNDLIRECFLDDPSIPTKPGLNDDRVRTLRCGEPQPIHHELPGTSAANVLERQSTRQTLGKRRGETLPSVVKASLVAEERRSALINLIGDTAFDLAEKLRTPGLNEDWSRVADGLEARDFGLTFVVDDDDLSGLFGAPKDGARVANFEVRKRTWMGTGWTYVPGKVSLLRHPSENFDAEQPRLHDARVEHDEDGFKLFWDLETADGGRGGGAFIEDPETHLAYYEIERSFEGADVSWTANYRTRSATPIDYRLDDTGLVVATRSRAEMHLNDDLTKGGIPEDLRALILGTPVPSGRSPHEVWASFVPGIRPVFIVYKVVAVDQMGSKSRPWVIEHPLKTPRMRVEAPLKTELSITHTGQLSADVKALPPELRLNLVFADEAAVEAAMNSPYLLRVRAARLRGGGQYGADAVDDARNRPGQLEIEQQRNELDFDLELTPMGPKDPAGFPIYFLTSDEAEEGVGKKGNKGRLHTFKVNGLTKDAAYDKVLDALRIPYGAVPDLAALRSCRVFLKRTPTKQQQDSSLIDSLWSTAATLLTIRPTEENKDAEPDPDTVTGTYSAVVETLEHPLKIIFPALTGKQITPESGRLELIYPDPDATIEDLETDATQEATVRLLDPQRRSAVRLKINAYGATLKEGELQAHIDLASLVGGFDIFDFNPARVRQLGKLDDLEPADIERECRHRTAIQVLPRSLAGYFPDSVSDFKTIEVRYPSDTRRALPPTTGQSKNTANTPRQGRWYSRSETQAAFPPPVLRRGLMTAPDETLISALLHNIDVETVEFRLIIETKDNQPPEGLNPAQKDAWVVIARAMTELQLGSDQSVSKMNILRETDGVIGSTYLRKKLRSLVLADTTKADREYRKWRLNGSDPALAVAFVVKLAIKSIGAVQTDFREEEVSINLATGLHPVLAEAIDELRYERYDLEGRTPPRSSPRVKSDPDGQVYRAYEPVLEAQPPLQTKGYDAFLDAFPASADPYGWGALRCMGLAVGLRLYDIDNARYVAGRNLFALVRKAFDLAIARYEVEIGAPFVELVDLPEDFMAISSYSGRDFTNKADTKAVRDGDISIIQLSLRPRPAQQMPKSDQIPVADRIRYVVLRRTGNISNGPRGTQGPVAGAVIDLLDSCGMTRDGGISTFTNQEVASWLYGEVSKDHITPPYIDLDRVRRALEGSVVAFLRVTLAERPAPWEGVESWITGTFGDLVSADVAEDTSVGYFSHPAQIADGLQNEAFSTFPPLTGRLLARVEAALKDPEGSVRTPFELFRANLPIGHGLEVVWPTEANPAEEAIAAAGAIMQRYADWAERFLLHGSGQNLAMDKNSNKVHFAFASLTAEETRARIPDVNGEITAFFVEPSRNGSEKLFAVRPFGRYTAIETQLTGYDRIPLIGALPKDKWRDHFVLVTLPRVRPLATPAILAAGLSKSRRPNGLKEMEITIARTPDQVIALANIPAEEALQPAWTALELRRSLPSAARLRASKLVGIDIYDGLEPIKATANGGKPTVLEGEIITPGDLVALRESVPDAWRGSLHFRFAALPHFFQIAGLVHQSAGAVVSDVGALVLPRSDHTLRLPVFVGEKPDGVDLRLDWPARARPPVWAVRRRKETDKETLVVDFELPLSRNLDLMADADLRVWTNGQSANVETVFRLSDSEATYRIGALAADLSSMTTLVDIMPVEIDPVPITVQPFYVAIPAGDRFRRAHQGRTGTALTPVPGDMIAAYDESGKAIQPGTPAGGAWNWSLPIAATVSEAGVDPDPTPADLSVIATQIGHVENMTGFDAEAWSKWAPRRSFDVTVVGQTTSPAVKKEIADLIAHLQPFDGDPEVAEMIELLAAIPGSEGGTGLYLPGVNGTIPLGLAAPPGGPNVPVATDDVFRWDSVFRTPGEGDRRRAKVLVENAYDITPLKLDAAVALINVLGTRWTWERRRGFAGRPPVYVPTPIKDMGVVPSPFAHFETRSYTFEPGVPDRAAAVLALCDALLAGLQHNKHAEGMAVEALDRFLVSDNTVLAKVVTIEVPVAAGVGDIAVAGLSEVRSDAWMIGLHLPPEPGDWKQVLPPDIVEPLRKLAAAQIFGTRMTPQFTVFHSDKPSQSTAIEPAMEI